MKKITNISGDPANKVRRQSPVIGGARIYPGSTIELSETQWEQTPGDQKQRILALEAIGILIVEHIGDIGLPHRAAGEDKGDKAASSEGAQDEDASSIEVTDESDLTEDGSGTVDSNEVDVAEEDVKDAEGVDEEAEDITDVEAAPEEIEEDPEPEIEDNSDEDMDEEFDFVAFFEKHPTIPKIKVAFENLDPKPSITSFIEYEKANQNRSSLIEWFGQQPD